MPPLVLTVALISGNPAPVAGNPEQSISGIFTCRHPGAQQRGCEAEELEEADGVEGQGREPAREGGQEDEGRDLRVQVD